MKKVQVTWGWEPPRYETRKNGSLRLFYRSEQRTETRERVDEESGETISEEVTFWVCDALDYEPSETRDLVRVLRNNPEDVECHRWMLKEMIAAYDSSEAVNSFSIGGYPTWLDKATRVGLKLRFEAEIRLGKTETTLWQNGMSFPLPLVGDTTALDMLDGIELYASSCYDVTQMHLAAVNTLLTASEVLAYDYKAGYPTKLAF